MERASRPVRRRKTRTPTYRALERSCTLSELETGGSTASILSDYSEKGHVDEYIEKLSGFKSASQPDPLRLAM